MIGEIIHSLMPRTPGELGLLLAIALVVGAFIGSDAQDRIFKRARANVRTK